VRLLVVKHLEMLFNVCGSQGPEILCGNGEAVGTPHLTLPLSVLNVLSLS
jgi:hypothetical protein